MPVMITGLKDVPEVGDILKVVPNEKLAKKTAAEVAVQREKDSASATDFNLDFITSKVKEDNFKGIKIVLKADTIGSLEAVKDGLKKIKTDNARVKVVRARTGMITQSDVLLAQASGAIIIGFTTGFASKDVRNEAKVREVDFFKYNIIYKLIEDTAQLMVSSLEPEFEDIDLGVFTTKKVFLTEKSFMIVGGKVTEGKVQENAKIKVFRKGKQVTDGRISKVQRGTNQVKEVEKGDECGVQFESSFRLIDGDELHLYKTIKKKIQLQKI
jgi:translation initiation factor IF-2